MTAVGLASLARAWSELEDRKRILRGIPLPGQLRPDLDPVQMMKALKRAKSRKSIDLQPSAGAFAAPADDEDEPTSTPTTPEKLAKVAKPEAQEGDKRKDDDDQRGEPKEGEKKESL